MEANSKRESMHRSSCSFKFSNDNSKLDEKDARGRNKTQKPDGSNSTSSFSDEEQRKSENLSPMK